MPATTLSGLTDQASNFIIYVVVGITAVWVLSTLGETVLSRFRPIFPFLIAAALAGVLLLRIVARL